MSTPVLAAIIVVGIGVVFLAARRRLADGRSVEAHHRALETMGRLAAQHPSGQSPEPVEGPAGQAHVRVVNGAEGIDGLADGETRPAAAPPHPAPVVRSATSPTAETAAFASWGDVSPAGATRAQSVSVATTPTPAPALPPPPMPTPPAAVPTARGRRRGRTLWPSGFLRDVRDTECRVRPEDAELAKDSPVVAVPAAPVPSPAPALLRFDDSTGDLPAVARRPGRLPRWPRHSLPRHSPPRHSLPRRPRFGLPVVGALIALLLVGGVIGGMALRGPHRPHPTTGPPPATPATAPSAHPAVVPASTAPVLVTTSAGYSEYRLTGPATVQLAADAVCWIEIRQGGPSGPVRYQGDLAAGQTRLAPPSAWVRLGNPGHVTVTVNGIPISLPSLVAGQPYNVMFE